MAHCAGCRPRHGLRLCTRASRIQSRRPILASIQPRFGRADLSPAGSLARAGRIQRQDSHPMSTGQRASELSLVNALQSQSRYRSPAGQRSDRPPGRNRHRPSGDHRHSGHDPWMGWRRMGEPSVCFCLLGFVSARGRRAFLSSAGFGLRLLHAVGRVSGRVSRGLSVEPRWSIADLYRRTFSLVVLESGECF